MNKKYVFLLGLIFLTAVPSYAGSDSESEGDMYTVDLEKGTQENQTGIRAYLKEWKKSVQEADEPVGKIGLVIFFPIIKWAIIDNDDLHSGHY